LNVYAEVNHGRWIAKCPFCAGAELAMGDAFFCQSCKMVVNGGRPISLNWPAARASIEHLLGKRPLANRNWLPGESVDMLRAENLMHGLEVA